MNTVMSKVAQFGPTHAKEPTGLATITFAKSKQLSTQ